MNGPPPDFTGPLPPPLHDQMAALGIEVGDLLVDVARVSGRLAELHHRLWHLTQETDPGSVEDGLP